MKKAKTLLAVLLAIFMAAVAGCTTDAPSSQAAPAEEPQSQAQENAAEPQAEGNNEATQPSGNGAYKIGIATREITNDYNRNIISGAQTVLEGAGHTAVVTDAQADPQKHNENIENLINSGIDGLIVQLGDPQQLAPIMAKAKEKGIPVITAGIGSPVSDTITDINGDDPLMTTLAADALLSSIGYKGNVYIAWVPGAPLLETRKRIFEAIAADYPDVVLHEIPCEHNPAKVQTQIEEIMTANPEEGSIAAIFATYDALMSGASEAIRRAGRGGEINIVGIDGDLISFQMLFQEGGPFITSVVQDATSIGTKSAEILLGVMNGTIDPATVAPKTAADCYVATRKNGVAAAELRWTTSFWEDAGLDKAEVEKLFPQSEDVLVSYPVLP